LNEALEALIAHLNALLDAAEMPASLADCGVTRSSIPTLADEAAKQWTATFNPRPVAKADFERLFEAAFAPRSSRPK